MTRQQVLDLYFVEARARLIDVAAFLDRVQRATGAPDFRVEAFLKALDETRRPGHRARRALLALSDPTTQPLAVATEKSACGAWRKPKGKVATVQRHGERDRLGRTRRRPADAASPSGSGTPEQLRKVKQSRHR